MDVKFRSAESNTLSQTAGNIAVVVWKGAPLDEAGQVADQMMAGAIQKLLDDGEFIAQTGQTIELPLRSEIAARWLYVVGAGDRAEVSADTARQVGAAAAKAFGKRGGAVFAHGAFSGAEESQLLAELALGAGLGGYRFDQYHTPAGRDPDAPAEPELGEITVVVADSGAGAESFRPRAAALHGAYFTRDLVNEPANVLGTTEFANRLQALSHVGLEVEVLGESELAALGMRTLLAVGHGSEQESHVVVMRWQGAAQSDAPPFALVGKGVVFDTGGISLKPAKGMEEMTMDMGGAAVVAGTMQCLAERKAKANVVGLVGLVENMPDGRAQRPGDIVTSMAGKTVEVINTDAEGRLVLADVLWYAQDRFAPSGIVDLATLTGAMMVSLGTVNAGFFANDEDLALALTAAADVEKEGLWRMPLGKEYAKNLKSRLADLKNVSDGPWGGAITAAEFLHAFIREGTPWAHIDIAGVTSSTSALPLSPKGATGWGVRTLDRLIADCYEDQ